MTERDDLDDLRNAARKLVNAIDDMHNRGETFTARVSVATYELRRLLATAGSRSGGTHEIEAPADA